VKEGKRGRTVGASQGGVWELELTCTTHALQHRKKRSGTEGSCIDHPLPHLAGVASLLNGACQQLESLLVVTNVGRKATLITNIARVLACVSAHHQQQQQQQQEGL
jgi:hypothetical protein